MKAFFATLAWPLVIACSAGSVCVSESVAQEFNTPTFYMWGDYPQGHVPASPMVRRQVKFNLFYNSHHTNVQDLAKDLADEVAEEILAGRLTSETVMVVLQNFGMDSEHLDLDYGDTNPEPTYGGIRFFLDEDRIQGINEWDQNIDAHTFPDPRIASGIGGRDYRTARSYRHPFIKNALPDLNGVVRAPLRQWMKTFLTELTAQYVARAGTFTADDNIPHPATYKWYFDIEPLFLGAPTRNSVFMLRELASRVDYWSNPQSLEKNYLWAYRNPNGSPKTLAELYDEARIARGWSPSWQTSVDLANQLDSTDLRGSEAAANREIMTWFYEVTEATRNHVIDNCFFSVLREQWANPGIIQCGNYGMFSTDGLSERILVPAPPDGIIVVPETTGWFQDRAWVNNSLTQSNVDRATLFESEYLPRFTWNKARGGPMYYLDQVPLPTGHRQRYLEFPTTTSGTAHSPVWYPMGRYELTNDDGQQCAAEYEWCDSTSPNDRLGHKRRDVYGMFGSDLQRPLEGFHRSSMRVHRFNAESTINSGFSNVVPWMQMVNTAINGSRPLDPEIFYEEGPASSLPDEARDYLRLFRSKNLKEGLYWTSWYPGQFPPGSMPTAESLMMESWQLTEDQITRVYSNRVASYTRTQHTAPVGGYMDAGETAQQKSSRLEFTLRDDTTQYDREVDIRSKLLPSLGGSPPHYQTALTVEFEYPLTNHTGSTLFEIALECSIKPIGQGGSPGITYAQVGKVLMWQDNLPCQSGLTLTGTWVEVGTYTFAAPPSAGDGWQRTRIKISTGPVVWGIYNRCAPDGSLAKSKLRLIHDLEFAFESRYDLVQLTPVPPTPGVDEGEQGLALSDVNADGLIDAADFDLFMYDWMESEPAADLDVNEAVDTEDLETFIEAYTTGT